MDIIRKQIGETKKTILVGKTKKKKQVKFPHFAYFNEKTKKKIKEQHQIDRIKSLRIPPGYKNVEISNKSTSKVQAIGEDDKGRKQYIYSVKHVRIQTDVKFHELIMFGKYIEQIRSQILKNIKKASSDPSKLFTKESLISLSIYLIDTCHFRVGCEKYKRLYNSYGVTTLNKTHIKMENGKMLIDFLGKKGVQNKSNINDKRICKLLNHLCRKNNKEYLFETGANDMTDKMRITERHINSFLKEYNPAIKVKMFRTWNANTILLNEILKCPMPLNKTEAENNIKIIIEAAAAKLHHTKSVSKSSYMNNKLLDLYTNDINTFNMVCKQVKKKHGGRIPNVNKLLIALFIYLDKKK